MKPDAGADICHSISKPMRAFCNVVISTTACLALLLCIVSCDTKPEVLIDCGAVYAESYMWCDEATFDKTWSLHAGVLVGTKINPPINIPTNILAKGRPFPTGLEARWFHFGQQKFYEAILTDPTIQEKALAIIKRHGAFNFDKRLFVSIYDSGKVELWFGLKNMSNKEQQYIELIGAAQGYEVEGDASVWAEHTEDGIKKGRIPASVLDNKE